MNAKTLSGVRGDSFFPTSQLKSKLSQYLCISGKSADIESREGIEVIALRFVSIAESKLDAILDNVDLRNAFSLTVEGDRAVLRIWGPISQGLSSLFTT